MALPQPPDTQPLSKVYEHQRALATATEAAIEEAVSDVRRVGSFQQNTNTAGTNSRVDFDTPFPIGVVPEVMVSVKRTGPSNITFACDAYQIDRFGFSCNSVRSSGSATGTLHVYIAVAP